MAMNLVDLHWFTDEKMVVLTDEVDVILTRLPLPYFFFYSFLSPFIPFFTSHHKSSPLHAQLLLAFHSDWMPKSGAVAWPWGLLRKSSCSCSSIGTPAHVWIWNSWVYEDMLDRDISNYHHCHRIVYIIIILSLDMYGWYDGNFRVFIYNCMDTMGLYNIGIWTIAL